MGDSNWQVLFGAGIPTLQEFDVIYVMDYPTWL